MLTPQRWIILILVFAGAFSRLIPHPPNLTALSALALFSGIYIADKRVSYLLVLAAMFISDLFLGFHALTPVVYGCLLLTLWMGNRYGRSATFYRLPGLIFSASMIFFCVTNFSVWALGGLYQRTLEGLVQCFIAAIPFYHNQLLGDIFYCTLLFGSYALCQKFLIRTKHGRCEDMFC